MGKVGHQLPLCASTPEAWLSCSTAGPAAPPGLSLLFSPLVVPTCSFGPSYWLIMSRGLQDQIRWSSTLCLSVAGHPSLHRPQMKLKGDTLNHCAWEQGHLGLDTGALGLLGCPLCVLPTLAMLRGPGYGWPAWIQMEYFWFFKMKILFKIVFLYGKICAR